MESLGSLREIEVAAESFPVSNSALPVKNEPRSGSNDVPEVWDLYVGTGCKMLGHIYVEQVFLESCIHIHKLGYSQSVRYLNKKIVCGNAQIWDILGLPRWRSRT